MKQPNEPFEVGDYVRCRLCAPIDSRVYVRGYISAEIDGLYRIQAESGERYRLQANRLSHAPKYVELESGYSTVRNQLASATRRAEIAERALELIGELDAYHECLHLNQRGPIEAWEEINLAYAIAEAEMESVGGLPHAPSCERMRDWDARCRYY